MQTLLVVFVVVAAVAIVLEMLLLFAFYLQFRRLSGVLTQVSTMLERQLSPVLVRVERMLDESQGQMREILNDTSEIMRLVKTNTVRVDRVLDDATDRLRLQIIHADRMITGALEAVEETGSELRSSVIEPLHTTIAFVRGVRAGIDFFRGRKRMPERRREAQDEGLFI
jgi:hypothetical protein